jgi:hypothetical protein
LRRIFGPNRDGVTGGWRNLHNEELHNLYSSSSIIRIIKSRRMRWADMWHEWGRRGTCIGRKAREKETSRKTEKYVDR